MSHLKNHRMTAKAQKARELIADIHGVRLEHVRADRAAVTQMYRDLESSGYMWVATKQEWAKNQPLSGPPDTLVLTMTCLYSQIDDAEYILRNSLEAGGFNVVMFDTLPSPIDPSVGLILLEVEL